MAPRGYRLWGGSAQFFRVNQSFSHGRVKIEQKPPKIHLPGGSKLGHFWPKKLPFNNSPIRDKIGHFLPDFCHILATFGHFQATFWPNFATSRADLGHFSATSIHKKFFYNFIKKFYNYKKIFITIKFFFHSTSIKIFL